MILIIAATGDIHSPLRFEDFIESLKTIKKPDVLLLCGDMVNMNSVWEMEKISSAIHVKGTEHVYACFGNAEYDNSEEKYRSVKDVVYLNDESVVLEIKNKRVCIIGTRGCLTTPTPWQRKNRPDLKQVYKNRLKKIEALLEKARKEKYDYTILFMHYSPTFKTLIGEGDESRYGEMAEPEFEKIIAKYKPDIVLHAHSHYGTKRAEIEGIPVYNVSFPLNKGIKLIDLE